MCHFKDDLPLETCGLFVFVNNQVRGAGILHFRGLVLVQFNLKELPIGTVQTNPLQASKSELLIYM